MAIYEIVVTDVTCYGALYCVAGWNLTGGGMVRPEPPTANAANEASRFWDAQYAGPGKFFSVGNLVRFEANAPPANFPYPHATEDRLVVVGQSAILGTISVTDTANRAAQSVSQSIPLAFGGALVRANSGKGYVPSGHNGPSLGAVEMNPANIALYVDDDNPNKPKLRARLTDNGSTYDFSVPADASRSRWKAGGLDALRADIQNSQRVHVRLGLSRPFAAMPNSCYAQVNGFLLL